jgi:hypothetical protein
MNFTHYDECLEVEWRKGDKSILLYIEPEEMGALGAYRTEDGEVGFVDFEEEDLKMEVFLKWFREQDE